MEVIGSHLGWIRGLEEGGKEVDDGKEEGMMARGSGWGICLVLVGRAGLGFSFACCELV